MFCVLANHRARIGGDPNREPHFTCDLCLEPYLCGGIARAVLPVPPLGPPPVPPLGPPPVPPLGPVPVPPPVPPPVPVEESQMGAGESQMQEAQPLRPPP